MDTALSRPQPATLPKQLAAALQAAWHQFPQPTEPAPITLLCPNRYTQAWLEEQLYSEASFLQSLPGPLAILPIKTWLARVSQDRQSTIPLNPISAAGAESACYGLYFKDHLPAVVQSWFQSDTSPSSGPWFELIPDTYEPVRQFWRVPSGYYQEASVCHWLTQQLQAGIAPGDIRLIANNSHTRTHWIQVLAQAGLPVWGQPPYPVMQAWAQHLGKLLQEQGGKAGLTPAAWLSTLLTPNLVPSQYKNHWYQLVLWVMDQWTVYCQQTPDVTEDLDHFLSWIKNPDTDVTFLPSRSGIRVLTWESAAGIGTPITIIPSLHLALAEDTLDDLQQVKDRQQCLRESHTVVGTMPIEDDLALNPDDSGDWQSTWTEIPLPAIRNTPIPMRWDITDWETKQLPPPQASLPVLSPGSPLALSPTTIERYLKCPRQFFYQNLLGLREETTSPQAQQGTLIHSLMELLNQHHQADYTFTRLKALTEALFAPDATDDTLKALGFKAGDIRIVRNLTPLQRQQVKRHILLAFSDLNESGYFNTPFKALMVESNLTLDNIPGAPNVTLQGRADLIRQLASGEWQILDYKTTQGDFNSKKPETNLKPLLAALEPLDWEEPQWRRRYQKRYFQLPLYSLMLSRHPEFQEETISAGIQLVRSKGLNSGIPGSTTLMLEPDTLVAGQENLLTLLAKGVAEPLAATTRFTPLGDKRQDCSKCAYQFMCEGPADDEDSEETWE